MSQLAYNAKPAIAYAGLLSDLRPNEVVSKVNTDAAVIPFGRFVTLEAADSVDLPTAMGDVIYGCALHSHAYALAGAAGIPVGEMVSVCRKGVVWMLVDGAAVEGAAVYVVINVAGGEALGSVGSADDAGNRGLLPGARFAASADSGALVPVEFDLITIANGTLA